MLLFIQLYAILFYLAMGNASLMLFNNLTYLLTYYNCACYCELLLQNLKAMALQILCASYNILLCICIFITLLHIYLLIHVCFYTW